MVNLSFFFFINISTQIHASKRRQKVWVVHTEGGVAGFSLCKGQREEEACILTVSHLISHIWDIFLSLKEMSHLHLLVFHKFLNTSTQRNE